MKKSFDCDFRVYYDSTDAGGIVYHSKYLDFCERARTEFLRSKGIVQSKLFEKEGIGFVVSSAELKYKKSAILDDLIRINVELVENSGVALKMKQEIKLISRKGEKVDCEPIFYLDIDIVCVNRDAKPTRIPKNIMEVL